MDGSSGGQPTPNILIVDDVPASLALLSRILEECGYKARPVPSGELALRAAAINPPDLILLDIDLPDMTGFEVCERLRTGLGLENIPVIFISALTDIAEKVKGFSVGGVDYITKPFQIEEVHARVTTHLELRRQRRELQESYDRLRDLEALRDSLVHMIVHDLRSPLTGLEGFLGVLKDRAAPMLPPRHREGVEEALNVVKRLLLMVNSVLDVNRLEAKEMMLKIEECDIVALAREVVESLSSLAEGRVLALRPANDELVTSLDRGIVFRVIQNLVANALKFAPASEGQVFVEIDRIEGATRVRVTDNGPGIPRDRQDLIFEKFSQVGEAAGRRMLSTGLGLPFSKLAIEAHAGRIGVDSEAGKGATFWFTLPDGARRPQTTADGSTRLPATATRTASSRPWTSSRRTLRAS